MFARITPKATVLAGLGIVAAIVCAYFLFGTISPAGFGITLGRALLACGFAGAGSFWVIMMARAATGMNRIKNSGH
jgi:hypothetical protein